MKEQKRQRSRTWWSLPVLAGLLCLSGPALRAQQTPPAANDRDTTRTELASFDRFLDSHPRIARDLRQNPALVNDPNYLAQHPELAEFLQRHPGVREELRENPRAFLRRERQFERRGGDITRGELRNFDAYLDQHPDVARELRRDPSLVNNPDYLKNHPGLREFLENHPGVREELRENPRAFLQRERKYERRENRRGEGRRHRN